MKKQLLERCEDGQRMHRFSRSYRGERANDRGSHTTTTRNSDNSITGEEEAIARAVEASMLDERRTRGGCSAGTK